MLMPLLCGDGSLVEEHLPAVVAFDPDGGVVGGGVVGGDVVGGQGGAFVERGDVEVAHGGGASVGGEQGVGELAEVEDTA